MRYACVLVLGLLVCFQVSAQSHVTISGDYAEARSGEVYTCGCLFSSEQVSAGREAILAWDIREGEYNGTPLAGLKAVAVVVGTGNLGVPASSRESVLYVDSASTGEQRQAIRDLLSGSYGQALGQILATHVDPISFQKSGGETSVRVGDTVALVLRETQLPQDAHPGSTRWYDPFIPVKAPVLATSLYNRFWGPDFGRQWWTSEPGITGYTGDFVLTR